MPSTQQDSREHVECADISFMFWAVGRLLIAPRYFFARKVAFRTALTRASGWTWTPAEASLLDTKQRHLLARQHFTLQSLRSVETQGIIQGISRQQYLLSKARFPGEKQKRCIWLPYLTTSSNVPYHRTVVTTEELDCHQRAALHSTPRLSHRISTIWSSHLATSDQSPPRPWLWRLRSPPAQLCRSAKCHLSSSCPSFWAFSTLR